MADWDGDGTDTFATREGNLFTMADGRQVAYGRAGDVVYVGDWDGDGTDTFAVRRGNRFLLSNHFEGGEADVETAYGREGDQVHVGDWNGDGVDDLMVRRGNHNPYTYGYTGGPAVLEVAFGRSTDLVLVGDWDGDGQVTLGMVREGSVPTVFSERVLRTQPSDPADYPSIQVLAFPGRYNGYPNNAVSTTRPYSLTTKVHRADGKRVELQRRSGADWVVVDDTIVAGNATCLTIPARGSHREDEYRVVVPGTGDGPLDIPDIVSETVPVLHYRAQDLPPNDLARTVSEVLAPYCQDVPVIVQGDENGDLQGRSGPAAGLAFTRPEFPDLEIVYIARALPG